MNNKYFPYQACYKKNTYKSFGVKMREEKGAGHQKI